MNRLYYGDNPDFLWEYVDSESWTDLPQLRLPVPNSAGRLICT